MNTLLLKNGWIIDPQNKSNAKMDIKIQNSRIDSVAEHIDDPSADEVLDLEGKVIMPGIIDTHVHLRYHLDPGYKMLAKAGVTTAVDFAGPVEDIIRGIGERGSGINVAVLNGIIRGRNIDKDGSDFEEIKRFIENSLEAGSYGIKILGGHYPLSAEITERIIEHCNERETYIAFHVGTKEIVEPFLALKQAVDIAGGRSLHLAHINSYCRGQYKDYLEEMTEAMQLLDKPTNIVSDSYLSDINGTSGRFEDDEFKSNVTKRDLQEGGYPLTKAGMRQALNDGYVRVAKEIGGVNTLVSGEEGYDYWEEMQTDIMVSFYANPCINSIAIALHKNQKGDFTVDTISTDGGGIPRNSIVHLGLPLTRYKDFTLEDFVRKTSQRPAQLFGFANKGHLSPGADADITVLDVKKYKPYMTVAHGKIIMLDGHVMGRGGRLICTEKGEPALRDKDIDYIVADVHDGVFFDKGTATKSD